MMKSQTTYSTKPTIVVEDSGKSLLGISDRNVFRRFRISTGVSIAFHVLFFAFWLNVYLSRQSEVLEIREITYVDENEPVARVKIPQIADEKPVRAKETKLVMNREITTKDIFRPPEKESTERGSQKDLITKLEETNPNAGGSSLSNNEEIDIPGEVGALIPNKPPERGAGERSRPGHFTGGGSQVKVSTMTSGFRNDYEATAAFGELSSVAVAAVGAHRGRPGPPGNGLGKNNYGVGVDVGQGTGAGLKDIGEGGIFGGEGGGAGLGGGGYGRRPGRGSGNGTGIGIGNGSEAGIAGGIGGGGGGVSIHELIKWMKAHPGLIPKLVAYDMGHQPGDLSSAVNFTMQGRSFTLYLSCNEHELLLRICLVEPKGYTMLKDNGIKESSNFLVAGDVIRQNGQIQSLISSRQAPGEVANRFYRIFWSWWLSVRPKK